MLKLVILMGINQLRKISLGLQVSTLLTYMLGFLGSITLKRAVQRKKEALKMGISFRNDGIQDS